MEEKEKIVYDYIKTKYKLSSKSNLLLKIGDKQLTILALTNKNKQLQEEVETLENIVGIRDKRHLIAKFNKEYQNEYLSKTDRRDIAGVTPDAEKVYELYYQQKDTIKELQDKLDEIREYCDAKIIENNQIKQERTPDVEKMLKAINGEDVINQIDNVFKMEINVYNNIVSILDNKGE